MCQQTKCCCCLPLRTGCIVIAIWAIVGSFMVYINNRVGYGYKVPVNLWGLAEGICLLVGAMLYNPVLVLVYFILAIIGTVGQLIGLIFVILKLTVWAKTTVTVNGTADSGTVTALLVVLIVSVVIGCILRIYFIVIAWSFHKELKTGGENMSQPA